MGAIGIVTERWDQDSAAKPLRCAPDCQGVELSHEVASGVYHRERFIRVVALSYTLSELGIHDVGQPAVWDREASAVALALR